MILNHLWGLYSNPQDEWRSIDAKHESMIYSMSHILVIALVPAICSYFSAVYLGWYLSFDEVTTLPPLTALGASLTLYALLVCAVFVLAFMAWRMALYLGATPTFTQAAELSSYAASPLFMSGFCALYPEIWFIALVGCGSLGYSIYLLFSGVPLLIHIDDEKRRTYSLALVACGLLLLIGLLWFMFWVYSG
jgi:hypothetical protein